MAIRSFFRPTHELVVVQAFRLDAQTMLVPGDKLPDHVRLFHRKSLYRRGIVGKAGDAWTLSKLPADPAPVEPEAS